jgi:hypothetical protein
MQPKQVFKVRTLKDCKKTLRQKIAVNKYLSNQRITFAIVAVMSHAPFSNRVGKPESLRTHFPHLMKSNLEPVAEPNAKPS